MGTAARVWGGHRLRNLLYLAHGVPQDDFQVTNCWGVAQDSGDSRGVVVHEVCQPKSQHLCGAVRCTMNTYFSSCWLEFRTC